MALVTMEEMLDFLDNPDPSENYAIGILKDEIEAFIKRYCRRDFESTTYTLEKYSGNGTRYIYLNDYPVISVQLVAVGTRDAMYVYNSYLHSYASVSVTATALVLSRDGTTDATLLFASYATLSTLATAVSAVGYGWNAAVSSNWYNDFKSTLLLKTMGRSAIESQYVYLQIPDRPETNFELDENNGVICLSWAPAINFRKIFVTYVAGYATIPSDLKYAVKTSVKFNYDKINNQTFGLDSYRIGDLAYNFSSATLSSQGIADLSIPMESSDILAKYKRRLV